MPTKMKSTWIRDCRSRIAERAWCTEGQLDLRRVYGPLLSGARLGEDVLWVGPKRPGENLWQYIRTFMEDGIDKVPAPNEHEWLRKGFHSPSQHVEEAALGPSRALDDLGGRGKDSIQTQLSL
ncbi:conserved protein of unknown function [Cupriavidus taiwanensis]|nr:conserved protein of unknown function [Cupriavidus taiwanensis]